MKQVTVAFRRHWPLLLVIPLLITIMTWPAAPQVLDRDTLWLPSDHIDPGMKFWDAWYAELILAGKADFYYTDFLFFPTGLSLVFHNFSVPHALLMLAAKFFLPPTSAYSLANLLIILANATACFVYLRYLFRDPWLGVYGSVAFGLSVYVIESSPVPDLSTVAPLPLVLYFAQRGLTERQSRWMVLAGLLAGFTAFIGMYIFVCLLISVGVFLCFVLPRRWKDREFWVSVLLLLALTGSVSALRIYPMMRDSAALGEALNKGGGQEHASDLLDFFVHRENVLTEQVYASVFRQPVPPVREDGYLGYVTLLLAGLGLAKSRPRREALFWFTLLSIFIILKLGSALTINGQTFDAILLPKHYLNNWFPSVFKAFRITAYFQIGMLLPLAVLAVIGLKRLRAALPLRFGGLVVLACLALNLLETIEPPDAYIIPDQQMDYIDWLRAEDLQDEIRLINVPFGTGPSKRYAIFHSYSGYPHAEGWASRTLSESYDYIRENLILDTWRNQEGVLCLPFNEGVFSQALDQLLADGFSHAVFHNDNIRTIRFANYSVMSIQPAYENEYARVYRLQDLRDICHESSFFSPGALPQIASIMSPSTQPGGNEDASASSAAGMPPVALPLSADGIALGAPISLADASDRDQLLPDDGIAIIAFYPAHAEPGLVETAAGRLASELKSCGRIEGPDAAAIEYFARREIPCALLISDDPLAVSYDNGVFLANVLLESDGKELETSLLWNKLPDDAHGVSIQLFDQAGEKVAGSDFTIRHDSLSRHQLDLSPLAPGDYEVKLILYHYETRASVAGVAVNAKARFERELEIGSVTKD